MDAVGGSRGRGLHVVLVHALLGRGQGSHGAPLISRPSASTIRALFRFLSGGTVGFGFLSEFDPRFGVLGRVAVDWYWIGVVLGPELAVRLLVLLRVAMNRGVLNDAVNWKKGG